MILTKDKDKFYKRIINVISKDHRIKLLIEALNEVYPDRWDIQIGERTKIFLDEYTNIKTYLKDEKPIFLDIIIYYPEVIIKNNTNKHKLTDLYVKLNFTYEVTIKSKELCLYCIEGTRSTRTLEEIKARYIHSHLPGTVFNSDFSNFCLGIGPLSNEIHDVVTYHDKDQYKYFLLLLDTYLQWESISGVPFQYLNNIGSLELKEQSIESAQFIVNDNKFEDINFKITDTQIEVIPDSIIEQKIFNILKEKGYSSFLCYKNLEGKYLSKETISVQQDHPLDGKFMNFTFKGEPVIFKILNTENISNYEYNAPNPSLTRKICQILSYRLTKKHITDSRIRQKNNTKDTKEDSTADTILVS